MNRCKTCKWWEQYRAESWGYCGHAKVEPKSWEDRRQGVDHAWYSYDEGGCIHTGPEFGCVHWEGAGAESAEIKPLTHEQVAAARTKFGIEK